VARAKDGGDVAGLPTAIELGEDAPAVQLFGDALQLPPADPPGFDLSEGGLLGEVVHQQLADGGAGQLRGGQRAGAELGAAIGKGVEAIVTEGDVAGELARALPPARSLNQTLPETSGFSEASRAASGRSASNASSRASLWCIQPRTAR